MSKMAVLCVVGHGDRSAVLLQDTRRAKSTSRHDLLLPERAVASGAADCLWRTADDRVHAVLPDHVLPAAPAVCLCVAARGPACLLCLCLRVALPLCLCVSVRLPACLPLCVRVFDDGGHAPDEGDLSIFDDEQKFLMGEDRPIAASGGNRFVYGSAEDKVRLDRFRRSDADEFASFYEDELSRQRAKGESP
eukprot:SAG31_NODE_4269_length_3392_cov_1.946250_2_plen_192_part_00